MLMTKSKININDVFPRYLKGELSKKERHDFERLVMSNPFYADAFDGLSKLPADELNEDLKSLDKRLSSKISKTNKIIWLASAASVFIIAGLVSWLVFWTPNIDKQEIAKNDAIIENDIFNNPERETIASVNKEQNIQSEEEEVITDEGKSLSTIRFTAPEIVSSDEISIVVEKAELFSIADLAAGISEESEFMADFSSDRVAVSRSEVPISYKKTSTEISDDSIIGLLALNKVVTETIAKINEDAADAGFKPAYPSTEMEEYKNEIINKIKELHITDEKEYELAVKISVLSTGIISDVEIIKSPINERYYSQVKKVIEETSLWFPAERDGVMINSDLQIIFNVK